MTTQIDHKKIIEAFERGNNSYYSEIFILKGYYPLSTKKDW